MRKGGLIPRYQTGAAIKDAAMGMIPIVGTYQDYKKFRDNPTWGNFGWLAASAIGDALFFTGAGAALKGIKAAAKSRALLTANRYGRSQAGFQRGLEYGASKGDVKSMFQNLRNYKVAKQKQLAAEAAARQQIISGARNIGKDLGQDTIVNTTQEIISERKGGSLTSDGRRFKFKDSTLAKNSKTLNNKRDMRKKFIKSDRPTYTNNRVKKNQSGGVLSVDPSIFVSWNNISTSNIKLPEVDYTPKSNLDRFLERTENSASINLLGNPKEQEEKQDQKEIPVSREEPIVKKTPLANPSKGNDAFNKIYDELISEMPDAAEYRDFLTTVAKYESGFDSRAKNKYAPAWGYFQFMQDDNKYNNIKSYAGVDTQTFLNNPKLQIRAAINLAKAMEKGFTKEDIEAAKSKGISRWGMLGGAWLGGNGGLRKYLLQNINSSDKHWNPEGKGIDMENQIRRYNF